MNFNGKRILILEGYARQCLPFLKEFKKLGCETTLLCNSKIDCGWFSRLPDHKIMGICDPDRYEDSEEYIVELIKTGNYDMVFPLVDFSASILAKHKEELSKYAKLAVNDKVIFERSQDKLEVMKICMENGIPCPKTLVGINSIEGVLSSGLRFPFIIKPRIGCGAKGFFRFETKEEFIACVGSCDIKLQDMVIQECIPADSTVMSANLFIDANGEVKSSFLYASKRIFPLKGGTGTFNVTIDRADIHEQCAELLRIMGMHGCVGIDLIVDSRDNIAKVIEINPRVLACAKIGFESGVNQALQTLQLEFGEEVTPYMEYKEDVRIRMSQTDVLWFLKSPNRFKSKPSFFSIKNTKDQMFAWSDPLPWLAFSIQKMVHLKEELNKRS